MGCRDFRVFLLQLLNNRDEGRCGVQGLGLAVSGLAFCLKKQGLGELGCQFDFRGFEFQDTHRACWLHGLLVLG